MLVEVDRPQARVNVAAELQFLLRAGHRGGPVAVTCDGVSSLGHVVESLGVPLTEVGSMTVNGKPAAASYRPTGGDHIQVDAVRRPQRLGAGRFILDVHLGTLARRLRLVGVDAAYSNDAADEALIDEANAGGRVLLTQDRGLLRQRRLRMGAYVRGARPDDQLTDVLTRFAPALAPWTRCPACNSLLMPAPKTEVEPRLQPGTRRTYDLFAECARCGRVYWRGAHAARLQAIVDAAIRAAGAPGSARLRRGPQPTSLQASPQPDTAVPGQDHSPQANDSPLPSGGARFEEEHALCNEEQSDAETPGSGQRH
jgi:uncharacterized protein